MSSDLLPSDSPALHSSFIPEERAHPQGAEFFANVTNLLDGQPKEPAVVEVALSGWDELLGQMAADNYRIGSMLVGEGEEAIGLIERVITNLDIQSCKDHVEARLNARLLLAAEAITVLRNRDAAALAAPASDGSDEGPVSCIEDDDLSAAGVTAVELEQMLSGPDNQHLRDWLEGLTISLRVIFVLRAVAGLSSPEVAGLLAEYGGAAAENWTPDEVRSTFRQALCSLASQLLHASAAK